MHRSHIDSDRPSVNGRPIRISWDQSRVNVFLLSCFLFHPLKAIHIHIRSFLYILPSNVVLTVVTSNFRCNLNNDDSITSGVAIY